MSILSPSAERLTVVSRVVPRTVQLAKMQMFGGRDEEEEEQEDMVIGREVQPYITTTRESTPTPQFPKVVNKRRMMSGDVSASRVSSPSQSEARARVGVQPTQRPPSPKTGMLG
ncbi:hypothetical protein E2C01_101024 [Portunus trituberculatus]|uniref:Uncharacterized protein n=1 Tax=Portunus trituberculatus TaxID=210409 RepID=A0A5B7KDN8_PORTR|nr:hypothetical protein [Portunus trituberculatus]